MNRTGPIQTAFFERYAAEMDGYFLPAQLLYKVKAWFYRRRTKGLGFKTEAVAHDDGTIVILTLNRARNVPVRRWVPETDAEMAFVRVIEALDNLDWRKPAVGSCVACGEKIRDDKWLLHSDAFESHLACERAAYRVIPPPVLEVGPETSVVYALEVPSVVTL